MDHATVVASGTKIAEEIGTSRSEVWRLIQQLRGLGVDVAGHPATGYQLRAVPDLLLPEMIAPLVKGTIFASSDARNETKHIHHYYKIGSTNSEAMHGPRRRARLKAAYFSPKNNWLGADAARIPGIRRGRRGSIVRWSCVRRCRPRMR